MNEPLTWEMLWERYRQGLQLRNFSAGTIKTQQTYFNRLLEYFTETHVADLSKVTVMTLHAFQKWLFYQPTTKNAKARTVASQNRVLSFVRSFFAYAQEEGFASENFAKDLKYAREPDALPKNILTASEAAKIVEMPDTSTALGYRDRCILEILYGTGIRKMEVLNLVVSDVNLEDGTLYIRRGKGAKDRVVPLPQIACQLLENYLKVIRPELLQNYPSNALFVSHRVGYPLGHHSLGQIIEKYTERAGIKKKVTPHLWRHTCATHLLQNEAGIRQVQELLGHRTLATTEKYLRLSITDLKKAHRRFHPRERGNKRFS
jgi:integrase/recombinase XerD